MDLAPISKHATSLALGDEKGAKAFRHIRHISPDSSPILWSSNIVVGRLIVFTHNGILDNLTEIVKDTLDGKQSTLENLY